MEKKRRVDPEEEKSTTRLKPKGKSWVWEHFQFTDSDEKTVLCMECSKKGTPKTMVLGTSNMRKHLEQVHNLKEKVKSSQKTLDLSKSVQVSLFSTLTQDSFVTALAVWVLFDMRPVSMFVGVGFTCFASMFLGKFHIPSRRTLTRRIKAISAQIQREVVNCLESIHDRL